MNTVSLDLQFNEALQIIRKRRGLSQGQLAKMLGRSQQVVCAWENGARFPGKKVLQKIEDRLGIRVEFTTKVYLLDKEGSNANE